MTTVSVSSTQSVVVQACRMLRAAIDAREAPADVSTLSSFGYSASRLQHVFKMRPSP
jgi:hypothetical protein